MTARLSITNFSLCRDCSEHVNLSDFEMCVSVSFAGQKMKMKTCLMKLVKLLILLIHSEIIISQQLAYGRVHQCLVNSVPLQH